jgi:undecaprenyl-diphosphatase
MRVLWQLIARLSQAETRLLASILMIAALLLAFGLLAEEVIEGETLSFDRKLMLALREAGNPGVPIGPPWLPEAARDISALGSTIVLGIILLAVVGYLLLTRRRAAAWLMLGAVLSGVALNNFLKFSFARARPDLVAPAVRVFTSSFPSGYPTDVLAGWCIGTAWAMGCWVLMTDSTQGTSRAARTVMILAHPSEARNISFPPGVSPFIDFL